MFKGGGRAWPRATPTRKGASGGYHGDLSIPGYVPKTPTVAPKPSQAAKGSAGTYSGAGKAYEEAVAALPASSRAPTEAATRTRERHVRTKRRQTIALRSSSKSAAKARRNTLQSEARLKRTEKAVKAERKVKTAPKPTPVSKPVKFQGRKTAGAPTFKALRRAKSKGTLKVNQRGYLTTPAVRKATATVKHIEARAAKRRSKATLPGLDSEQAQVARTVLRRGEKARATSREKLAAVETGLVESSLRNLRGGDLDSEGWRQERTSIYGTGPTGPTNVKASADRFFGEVRTDAGTSGAPTPGLLAQAAQGSAFPERYDERAPEAKAILHAYNKGKLNPGEQRKLSKAKAKASDLGLKGLTKGKQRKARRTPTIVQVGRTAQKKFGLRVSENPAFGGVEPVHTSGSYHYSGEAIDVSGDTNAMARFDRYVATRFGDTVAELFYDPGISIDNGVPIGPIGGHEDHVHVAIDEPGTKAYGLAASANGLPPTGSAPLAYYGRGSTPAAAEASAMRARAAARKGKALTPTQKARRTYRRLREAGVGTGKAVAEPKTSDTLAGLERKYGVAS